MPLLSFYLGRQFLLALGSVLSVFLGLILLFDTIELARRTVRTEGANIGELFRLALMKSPQTIQETLPFAVMIAVMFALFRLARNHELVIIRASGVSAWQALSPIVILAAVVGAISLTVINPLASGLYASYEAQKDALVRNDTTALDIGESGLWFREVKDGEAAIIHAQAVRQVEGVLELTNVSIIRTNEKNELIRRIEAQRGELRDKAFYLAATMELEPGKPPVRHDTYLQETTVTLAKVQDSFAAPDTISFWDLPDFISASQAAGFSALPHRLHYQSLLAVPLMLCAMVLLAASFFLTSQTRMAEWTLRGSAGVAAGFLLYFFSQFTYALGLSTTLPLGLAAWAPAVIALLLSMTYLFYREDG